MNYSKNVKGFTLIELITVMVILGVISSFSTYFVVGSMRSFVAVGQKNSLLAEGLLATEYMVRRIRNALPYSVRLANDNTCLEFMPIVASGLYLNLLPTVINGAFATGSITPIAVSPFTVSGGNADYLAIAANNTSELYGLFPASIAAIYTVGANTITLVDDKQWMRDSLTQRFYIVESVMSCACIVS
jgi:MSHA biogenesis protein MshO